MVPPKMDPPRRRRRRRRRRRLKTNSAQFPRIMDPPCFCCCCCRLRMNSAQARKKSKSPVESRNWLELPHDVISTILLKLGAIEILKSAQMVCTLWRKICKDPLMWRYIDMRNLRNLDLAPYYLQNMVMEAVDRSCGQLVGIDVDFSGGAVLLEYIADRSPSLQCLKFACWHGSITSLANVTKKLSLLEELEITHSEFSKEGVETIGRNCPLLKSLKMNNRRGTHCHCDDTALAIADNLHVLSFLQLLRNGLTNFGLKAILDGCPHLESLDLRQCLFIDLEEDVGKTCAGRIKNLRHPDDPLSASEYTNGCWYEAEYWSDNDYYPYWSV